MDYKSLSHTKWECKYHVVFIPKYRKKKLYAEIRNVIGAELRRLAEQKESNILEGHMMIDHVHMLIEIPPKYSVAQVVGYIKGKARFMLREDMGKDRNTLQGRICWHGDTLCLRWDLMRM